MEHIIYFLYILYMKNLEWENNVPVQDKRDHITHIHIMCYILYY
jgi:hypothetical protein